MANIQDVILRAEEDVHTNAISTEEKSIIANIDTLINELRGRGVGGKDFRMYSADELSRIAGSLALLKDSLVEILSKANRNVSLQEAVIKLKKANVREMALTHLETQGTKPTVDSIKSFTEPRVTQSRAKLAFLKEFAETAIYKWRSLNSILDVISNRIHVLQSQEADVNTQDTSLEIDLDALEAHQQTN